MLRPKKKIIKKEIRDPFFETVDQAQAHLEENRSRYLQIGIVAAPIGFNVPVTIHKMWRGQLISRRCLLTWI